MGIKLQRRVHAKRNNKMIQRFTDCWRNKTLTFEDEEPNARLMMREALLIAKQKAI